jgi:hypothetical protein
MGTCESKAQIDAHLTSHACLCRWALTAKIADIICTRGSCSTGGRRAFIHIDSTRCSCPAWLAAADKAVQSIDASASVDARIALTFVEVDSTVHARPARGTHTDARIEAIKARSPIPAWLRQAIIDATFTSRADEATCATTLKDDRGIFDATCTVSTGR